MSAAHTVTTRRGYIGWDVTCSCGIVSVEFPTERAARAHGDSHVRVAEEMGA